MIAFIGSGIIGFSSFAYNASIQISQLKEIISTHAADERKADSIRDVLSDICNPSISKFMLKSDFDAYKDRNDKRVDALFYGKLPKGKWN